MQKSVLIILAILAALVGGFYWLNTYIYNEKQGSGEPPQVTRSAPTDFLRVGNITVNNPGQAQGVMYLVYEEEGAPALSRELVLDEMSICASGSGGLPCMAMSVTFDMAFGGRRAMIEGVLQGDKVLVRKMRILAEGEEPLSMDTGSVFIGWMDARRLIQSCSVESVMQTHALDVYLTLKDGERLRAVEPVIDEVFRVYDEVRGICPPIPLATE